MFVRPLFKPQIFSVEMSSQLRMKNSLGSIFFQIGVSLSNTCKITKLAYSFLAQITLLKISAILYLNSEISNTSKAGKSERTVNVQMELSESSPTLA